MTPKVSLIVPIYNTSRYLPACLDSIIAQSHSNIEIVCVNDCSTDGSLGILQAYASRDERILIVSHPTNKGLPATRNTGMTHASGEYVRHVDSDDTIPIESTKLLLDIATKYGSEIVAGNADRIVGKRIVRGDWLRRHMKPKHNIRLQDDISLWQTFGDVWLYFFRRDFVDRSGIRFYENIQFGEDQIYMSAALTCANTISYCNEVVYLYRERLTSMTSTFSVSKIEDELAWPLMVREKIAKYPNIYLYNLLSASVYRFYVLEYGITHYEKETALELIMKARLIYEDLSIEQLYSPEAERAYWLLNSYTLHLIVLFITASNETIYSFLASERYRRLPTDEKELCESRFQRLRKLISQYIHQK